MSVCCVSSSMTWDHIDVITMKKFLKGCGLDFDNHKQVHRAKCYLRSKPKWTFLKKSKDWDTFYKPLMTEIGKHRAESRR